MSTRARKVFFGCVVVPVIAVLSIGGFIRLTVWIFTGSIELPDAISSLGIAASLTAALMAVFHTLFWLE